MSDQTTYLELSEESAHKFYEVTVSGKSLTVRYGRIGDAGQSQTVTLGTEALALAEAAKKLGEKRKKGYADAVKGARPKRKVTRRTMPAMPAPASGAKRSKGAPLLWRFQTSKSALGIYIDRERCWVGNEAGEILALGHDGAVHARYKLPDGVKALVADGDFLYAGCDDGSVYDLSGKAPRVAYRVAEDVDILWIDVHDGRLAVSDALGNVSLFDHEENLLWTRKSAGKEGWGVRCDDAGVYHGHSKGLTHYDWSGKQLWEGMTDGWVGFGWAEEASLFVSVNSGQKDTIFRGQKYHVYRFSKGGRQEAIYDCDGYLCSCASAEGGKYVFASGMPGDLYCFDASGKRLWKLATGCGVSQSMHYLEGKLYLVTHLGVLACVDVSEAAIAAAEKGVVPEVREHKPASKSAAGAVPVTRLETTTDAKGGVVVECFQEGSELRVRPVSPGYNKAWHCQFPRGLREAGERYVVEELRASRGGGFYRARGDIRRLVAKG